MDWSSRGSWMASCRVFFELKSATWHIVDELTNATQQGIRIMTIKMFCRNFKSVSGWLLKYIYLYFCLTWKTIMLSKSCKCNSRLIFFTDRKCLVSDILRKLKIYDILRIAWFCQMINQTWKSTQFLRIHSNWVLTCKMVINVKNID